MNKPILNCLRNFACFCRQLLNACQSLISQGVRFLRNFQAFRTSVSVTSPLIPLPKGRGRCTLNYRKFLAKTQNKPPRLPARRGGDSNLSRDTMSLFQLCLSRSRSSQLTPFAQMSYAGCLIPQWCLSQKTAHWLTQTCKIYWRILQVALRGNKFSNQGMPPRHLVPMFLRTE
jgi:hypothetical protein